MEEKRGLLLSEENKMESQTYLDTGTDALDAYMSGLSSQLGLVLRHIEDTLVRCFIRISCSLIECEFYFLLLLFQYSCILCIVYNIQRIFCS